MTTGRRLASPGRAAGEQAAGCLVGTRPPRARAAIVGRLSETVETPRLALTPWSEQDRAFLASLSSDPLVMRYIGDGRCWSADRTAEVSRAVTDHWRTHGFGWRLATEKTTSEPIGLAALNYAGEGTVGLSPDEFEIGWWLCPAVWGRGFAIEGARAGCLEAFGEAAAPSVVARIQPENAASARVATRLGMKFEYETTGRFGERLSVYRLAAADWAAPGTNDKPT